MLVHFVLPVLRVCVSFHHDPDRTTHVTCFSVLFVYFLILFLSLFVVVVAVAVVISVCM